MKVISTTLLTCFMLCTVACYAGENTEDEDSDTKKAEAAETTETKTPKHECTCTKNIFTGSLSGNLAFTTNYIFRGYSNSNNEPAVQGGLTYTLEKSGIYLNLWGSNVDLVAYNGEVGKVEFDTVVGISNDICKDFNYNLSFLRYNYPKAGGLNYNEVIGVLTYHFLIATVGYSPNVFNAHASGTYGSLGINYEIPTKCECYKGINLLASYGHYGLPRRAGKSYNDYMLGISKTIKDYVLMVQWTDTNHRFSNNSLDHGHIIGTVTVNF